MLLAESFIERNGTLFQVLATFIAVLLAWWFGTRSKRSKTFDYRVLSDVAIVTSQHRPEVLSVHFGSREVQNPFITEIEFRNTGTGVIQRSDFLEPVQIVRPGADILDWSIVKQSAKNLVLNVGKVSPLDGRPIPDSIEIHPETLNKQDHFVVQIVYDGDPKQGLDISCRIEDESRAMREIEASKGSIDLVLATMVMVVAVTGLVFTVLDAFQRRDLSNENVMKFLVFVLVFLSFAFYRRFRRLL